MTSDEYARARRTLLRRDPILASLIRRHGPCGLAAAQRADHFSALVRAITGQQLSTKAAATIYARMVALMPGGTPSVDGFAGVTDEQLRAAGMSRQKSAYLRDLCTKITSSTLDLAALDALDDEAVIAALTTVKGIGRWSAEMFLIFRLHRPDVLPVGDLGSWWPCSAPTVCASGRRPSGFAGSERRGGRIGRWRRGICGGAWMVRRASDGWFTGVTSRGRLRSRSRSSG